MVLCLVAVLAGACSKREDTASQEEEAMSNTAVSQASSGETPVSSAASTDPTITDLLSKPYAEILQGGTYYMKFTMEMKMEGQTIPALCEIGTKGGVHGVTTEIDMSVVKVKTRILMQDNKAYMIDDATKSYYEIPVEQAQANAGMMDYSQLNYVGNGTESLDGIERRYEEYESNGTQIRFYFGEVGLHAITVKDANAKVDTKMIIEEISNEVPDAILAFPDGYTAAQLPAMPAA